MQTRRVTCSLSGWAHLQELHSSSPSISSPFTTAVAASAAQPGGEPHRDTAGPERPPKGKAVDGTTAVGRLTCGQRAGLQGSLEQLVPLAPDTDRKHKLNWETRHQHAHKGEQRHSAGEERVPSPLERPEQWEH